MHYYKFNIGDYASHTAHLDPLEDIAYRRMIDWCYLHEKPLPNNIEEISRLIRMRTHCDSIANVLREFFIEENGGYINNGVIKGLDAYREKSDKAKASAEARWIKSKKKSGNANALRKDCERNANHKPLTTNQEPLTSNKGKANRFTPPTQEEVRKYCHERSNTVDPERFINHYTSNGWMVGKNKMKDWKAAVRTWEKGSKQEKPAKQSMPAMQDFPR